MGEPAATKVKAKRRGKSSPKKRRLATKSAPDASHADGEAPEEEKPQRKKKKKKGVVTDKKEEAETASEQQFSDVIARLPESLSRPLC